MKNNETVTTEGMIPHLWLPLMPVLSKWSRRPGAQSHLTPFLMWGRPGRVMFLVPPRPRHGHAMVWFSSLSPKRLLLFSHSVVSDSLWPRGLSTPGFPVLHHLPEPVQTHVHWVGDAVQPSHPLSSPSLAFNLSQHHGLFQWVNDASLEETDQDLFNVVVLWKKSVSNLFFYIWKPSTVQ